MNFYVSLINDTKDFIEDNINENISLEDISRRFCVSEFHFNRMFRTVTGWTLKQYILGRKLSRASECLSTTDESVINIAYDYGFANPEVFSRDFKKQFGTSPNTFRKFTDDLYRWVIVKEVELEYNGIGMLSIFQKDYPYTRQVEILVPVKNPMQIAKIVMKQ